MPFQVIAILDKIKNENDQNDAKSLEEGDDLSEEPVDDDNWGEDENDEDIIYVR